MAVKSYHETVVRSKCSVSVVADWFNKSLRVSKRVVQVSKRLHLVELIVRFIEERDTYRYKKTEPECDSIITYG